MSVIWAVEHVILCTHGKTCVEFFSSLTQIQYSHMQMDCDGNVVEETAVNFDDDEGCMGYSTDVIILAVIVFLALVALASCFACRTLRKSKVA